MQNKNIWKAITIKIERAKFHFESLTKEISIYLDSKPYVVSFRRDPDTKQSIYYISDIIPLPENVSAIMGDIFHNLRSALDHIAYQLVLSECPECEYLDQVYFPIADSLEKYPNLRDRRLKGANLDALNDVDGLKPYKGGNDFLWVLHKLNNIDKHRALITAGSVLESVDIGSYIMDSMIGFMADPEMIEAFREKPKMSLPIRPAEQQFPLKVGGMIFGDVPNSEPNYKIEFKIDISFGEKEVMFGEPVVNTVANMINEIEHILGKFKKYCV